MDADTRTVLSVFNYCQFPYIFIPVNKETASQLGIKMALNKYAPNFPMISHND